MLNNRLIDDLDKHMAKCSGLTAVSSRSAGSSSDARIALSEPGPEARLPWGRYGNESDRLVPVSGGSQREGTIAKCASKTWTYAGNKTV